LSAKRLLLFSIPRMVVVVVLVVVVEAVIIYICPIIADGLT